MDVSTYNMTEGKSSASVHVKDLESKYSTFGKNIPDLKPEIYFGTDLYLYGSIVLQLELK